MPTHKSEDYKLSAVEYYFSMLKSKLQKLDELTHKKTKRKYRKSNKRYIKKTTKKYLKENIIKQKIYK